MVNHLQERNGDDGLLVELDLHRSPDQAVVRADYVSWGDILPKLRTSGAQVAEV
jgi:hypothetical protein